NAYDRDEERIAALLRAVDVDVPPLDQNRLDVLCQQSTELFLTSGKHDETDAANVRADINREARQVEPALVPVPVVGKSQGGPECRSHETAKRRTPMLTLALRGLAGLTASAAIIVVWLLTSISTPLSGAVPFSEVLAE